MPKEWTDEEVQKEIADAVAIVREDRFEKFVRGNVSQQQNNPTKTNNPPNSGGTNPDPNAGNKKRKSLWWGETDE